MLNVYILSGLFCFGLMIQNHILAIFQLKSKVVKLCLSCLWSRACMLFWSLALKKVSLSHSDIYTYEKWIDDKCLVM